MVSSPNSILPVIFFFFLMEAGEKGETKECCYFYDGFDFKPPKEVAFTVAPWSVYGGIASSLNNLLSFLIMFLMKEDDKQALPSGCS